MSTHEHVVLGRSTKPVPASEADAIQLAKSGDSAGFEYLYNLHRLRVYALCLRMATNPTEAEDLTQDTFLQVFRKIHSFRGDSGFSTWLHRVAVNVVLMRFRRKKRVEVSLDEPLETSDGSHGTNPDPGQEDLGLAGTIDRVVLERALERLPDGYKRMFVLHDVQGYEHHEIASILGCSVGNSKSQLHKARLRMRALVLEQARRKTMVDGTIKIDPRAKCDVVSRKVNPQQQSSERKGKEKKRKIALTGFNLSPAKA